MRIAVVTPGFSADETDWCIPVLLNLVRRLAENHDVTVFSLRYPHHRSDYRVHGAGVRAMGGGNAHGLSRGPLLARTLTTIVAAGRPRFDIIHGFWADEAGAVAVAAARLLRTRSVVSVMGGELVGDSEIGYGVQLSEVGRRLVQWSLANADVVTVGSAWLAAQARPHVTANRLVAMPLGVDTGLFSPEGPAEPLSGAPRLLHVASLAPVKNQLLLLQAVALLARSHPQVHLHIAGEGPLLPTLAAQAQGLGLGSSVTFHGAVRHDLLPTYYRGADLFVLSSRFESQNMAVLEAAACGCAVVGTSVGILPELLPTACLAPPGSAEALALVLEAACRDLPRSQRQGALLCQRAGQMYALTVTLAQLDRIYGNGPS